MELKLIYEYHTGGRAVNSTAFNTRGDYTDKMRRALRKLANHQCQQCKGEGIYAIGTAEMRLCRCVPIY